MRHPINRVEENDYSLQDFSPGLACLAAGERDSCTVPTEEPGPNKALVLTPYQNKPFLNSAGTETRFPPNRRMSASN